VFEQEITSGLITADALDMRIDTAGMQLLRYYRHGLLTREREDGEYFYMLKKNGLKERPSKLEKHAYWWFQHYVKEKDWKAIANEEALINRRGGPNPDNIQKAVKKFSKIIGIFN